MAIRDWGDFRALPLESQKRLIRDLRCEGYTETEIRQLFGISKSSWKSWTTRAGIYIKEETAITQRRNTLCWKCAKAVGYCTWSHHLEPVVGWEAIEYPAADYEQGRFAKMPNYKVLSCPEFIEG